MVTIEEVNEKVRVLSEKVEEIGLNRPLELNKNTTTIDELISLDQLREEVTRLEKSNQEYHKKIVELHTELQETTDERDTLRRTLHVVTELVLMASDTKCISPGALFAVLGSIADVLHCGRKSLHDDIPDVIKETIGKMENSLNEDLPDGVSVSVLPLKVSSEKMSEILKKVSED